MADSQEVTKDKVMGEINMETVKMLYTSEVQAKCWDALMDIIENGKDRDKIAAVKEVFDRALGKPKQMNEHTFTDNFNNVTIEINSREKDNVQPVSEAGGSPEKTTE